MPTGGAIAPRKKNYELFCMELVFYTYFSYKKHILGLDYYIL